MYNDKNFRTAHPLTFGLSMVAGTGVTLMIVALGIGVVQAEANSYVIGMVFVIGLALMIIGVGGWVAVTRPFSHFDDINQPADDDHGHAHVEVHNDDHGSTIVAVDTPASVEKHGSESH